ncbi:MAG: hypothetical protein JKY37_22565, partial [Nannocystaceae bacterium]|nr:hypothetical protein [Nannocystaceae bacterium]
MRDPTTNATIVAQAAKLQALARSLTQGRDGDDLANDAVIAALTRPTAPRLLGAWLRRVPRNQYVSGMRREYRRRAREDALSSVEPASAADDRLV